MKTKGIVLSFLIAIIFFLISLFTISDYGISWDEPSHFIRGQAYLDFFLTGDSHYTYLPQYKKRSYYELLSQSASYFFRSDSGHPPLNGELAALFNRLFYQKLGLLGDIESYHLFIIASSAVLVFVISLFAIQSFGLFAGIISAISLATYPLFFSESHFNIKDPVETTFFALTIWAFWNSLKNLSWKWLLLSSISFGVALGTKFNILFLPFIILPWLFIKYFKALRQVLDFLKAKKFLVVLLLSPFIVGIIFFGTWPYLWQDPLQNTKNIVKYYVEIGTGGMGQPDYILPGGFNIFPLIWIITTTPLLLLFLTTVGVWAIFLKKGDKEKTSLLWLLWLIIPIGRVSVPDSSIYGGIRQIMEYIPAMALLSGLGASSLIELMKKFIKFPYITLLGQILILFLFVPHLYTMYRLHPNENVYFNSLIGGLKGAKEANLPYWGNSFGNAYYQAIHWLNSNAETGSKLALIQGTGLNIPKIYLNKKITYSNAFWSGIDRKGEYLLDLTHQGYAIAYPFAWDYVNTVLIPVYEVKVDGVAIAKIWKNDIEHSEEKYKEEKTLKIKHIKQINGVLEIELTKLFSIARLTAQFNNKSPSCKKFDSGLMQISTNGTEWVTLSEKISEQQVVDYPSLDQNGTIRYIFSAPEARYIRIKTNSENSCLFEGFSVVVNGFESADGK